MVSNASDPTAAPTWFERPLPSKVAMPTARRRPACGTWSLNGAGPPGCAGCAAITGITAVTGRGSVMVTVCPGGPDYSQCTSRLIYTLGV